MSIKEDNILTKAINKKISRRSFIKWSSALGATASMSGLVMQAGAKVAGAAGSAVPAAGTGGAVVEWKPTCCLVCHSWCSIAAGIDANGHIRKIEGCGGQPAYYHNSAGVLMDGSTPSKSPAKPLQHLTVKNHGWGGPEEGLGSSLSGAVAVGATTITLADATDHLDGQTITIDSRLATKTDAAAAEGATVIPVADTTGMYVGQKVSIDGGTKVAVTAVNAGVSFSVGAADALGRGGVKNDKTVTKQTTITASGINSITVVDASLLYAGQQITVDGHLATAAKLTGIHLAGVTTITVNSTTGLNANQDITIGGKKYKITGAAPTATTFVITSALAQNHDNGAAVNGRSQTRQIASIASLVVTLDPLSAHVPALTGADLVELAYFPGATVDGTTENVVQASRLVNVITLGTAAKFAHASGDGSKTSNWSGTNVISAKDSTTGNKLQAKGDDANHIPVGEGFLPYAPHNKGRICAKGNDGVEHLYDPDRIKYPLLRVGERGQGLWKKVTWKVALDTIANVLREMAGVMTDVDGGSNGGRGEALQHRLVHWVGRNEHFSPPAFSKTYGTPNHMEHTSICELSRHVAGRTLWGHHWSSVDLQEHSGEAIQDPTYDSANTLTLDRNIHDIDYYIEWGGNPAEAKIPHSSCANHLGDRRRSNMVGYSGATRTSVSGGTVLGRIVTIDVRQSNTAAFSDEYFQVNPGSDGALALFIMYGVLGAAGANADTVRKELDYGHNGGTGGYCYNHPADASNYDDRGRFYYGLFKSEENGLASGQHVPPGKSLESYLFSNAIPTGSKGFAEDLGLASTADMATIGAKVAVITGLSYTGNPATGQIDHLIDVFKTGGANGTVNQPFINVVTDGYRGPCKHTNGTYNYRAIRALQLIAPNYSASTFHAMSNYVPTVYRGGYNAPGAFQSDKNWNPYDHAGGPPKHNGSDKALGDRGSAASAIDVRLPNDEAVGGAEAAPSGKMRIDNWDYELDQTRWRMSYKWVDQNVQCGIRHAIGLHAFTKEGLAAASVFGPYSTYDVDSNGDPAFKVEALLIHKNAPTYSRPQQDLEIEMLTATDKNGDYLLKHFWSIDINMGDGTRFADIVLPDVSYLERYADRSGEGQEFNYRDNFFYRMPVYEFRKSIAGSSTKVPQHMYDSKQVAAIYFELARTIEPGNTTGTKVAPWNGSLYDSWTFDSTDTGSVAGNVAAVKAHLNNGEWAIERKFEIGCSGMMVNAASVAGAASAMDFARTGGMMWNTNDNPAYWRDNGFEGDGGEAKNGDTAARDNGFKMKTMKQALQIYNKVLDDCRDIDGTATSATKSDGKFYGMPVYKPTTLQSSPDFPRSLTTYKISVHTQARTACMPRLNEIVGNSWAVLPSTGQDSSGLYCLADDGSGRKIRNGEVVTVASPSGSITCVAKVTEKARAGCVHISHSQGHQRGIYTIDADEAFLNPHREAYGTYLVDGSVGRTIDRTIYNPAGSPVDDYAIDDVPPSAPGKGTHPNKIILHHVDGAAEGDNYNTDPIGASQGWFGTKVRVY